MPGSRLQSSYYRTAWSDNFTNGSMPNVNIFPVKWGNADDFVPGNTLTLISRASEGWANVGFLQPDWSPTVSQGYGLYSVTFSMNAGEGNGPAIVMWPSNNVWPGPEIDLVEDWSDPTRHTGYATIHWVGSDGSNQYQTFQFHADMTNKTAAAMDWEPGSLTFYVNNREVFKYTGPHVPKDAADGGVNEAFGAEVTAAGGSPVSSSVSLHLYSMSYSTYNGPPLKAAGNATSTISPTSVGVSDVAPVLVGPHTDTPPDQPAISASQGDVTYTFTAVQGQDVLNNFLPSDIIALTPKLAGEMVQTHQNGGTLLTFGSPDSSIFLPGYTNLSASQIHAT